MALFFSILGYSQSVSGKVETEEGLSIANVFVINLKTNEKVNTDENGKFTISAKLQDEICFVKKRL